MDVERLRALLERVKAGETDVESALGALRSLPYENLGYAMVDHHRSLRNGFPEVIYCPGKTTPHILGILERLTAQSSKILASRATPEVAGAIIEAHPGAVYHELARIVVVPGAESVPDGAAGSESVQVGAAVSDSVQVGAAASRRSPRGVVLIVSAGTADLPVAEEAAVTAGEMGSPVERLYDVGVAGIHRLLSNREQLFAANVVVVVAGMEGALASVVGGLVSRPVVAVPTSVGYGASFNGLAALLTMLNSCATGVGVVNIDNGFGAGFLAHLINQ
jgi:NCAIR mutase (PurE)-related protein